MSGRIGRVLGLVGLLGTKGWVCLDVFRVGGVDG